MEFAEWLAGWGDTESVGVVSNHAIIRTSWAIREAEYGVSEFDKLFAQRLSAFLVSKRYTHTDIHTLCCKNLNTHCSCLFIALFGE